MFNLIQIGGPVMWPILIGSLVVMTIFIERFLHLHRAQIKTDDFLNGLFNVIRRGNIVEAVSICEETPGPVAALTRSAVLHHDQGETVRVIPPPCLAQRRLALQCLLAEGDRVRR